MSGNLRVHDFKKVIFFVNRFHRSDKEFLEALKLKTKKQYFEGFEKIISSQLIRLHLPDEERYFMGEELTSSHKIMILDTLNIIEELCVKCGLPFTKPLAGNELLPECSFCFLVRHYYFKPDTYNLVVDADVTGEEAMDRDVYVIWQEKYKESIHDVPFGYIKNFEKLVNLRDDTYILKEIRREHNDYSDDDFKNMTDKELRSIIYHHNSSVNRIKAIANIKSKDVLYHIFHSLNEFKEAFIEKYYQLGGHSLDIMIFLLPPYLKSGDPNYDMGYRELVKQFRTDLQGQESKYPYWVETSKKLSESKDGEDIIDEEIPTTADIDYMVEEAKLGSAIALVELWQKEQVSAVAEIITDPDAQIPFDIRLMQVLEVIPSNDFQFTLHKILDIDVSEPSLWVIALAFSLMSKIKDPELEKKLYNHSHFRVYKEMKETEREKNKFLYDRGFS